MAVPSVEERPFYDGDGHDAPTREERRESAEPYRMYREHLRSGSTPDGITLRATRSGVGGETTLRGADAGSPRYSGITRREIPGIQFPTMWWIYYSRPIASTVTDGFALRVSNSTREREPR